MDDTARRCARDLHRPKLITAHMVARALSSADDPWDVQRARRFLIKERIGWKLGSARNSPIVTTTPDLLAHYPKLLDLILSELDQGRCHWCGRDYADG